MSRGTCTVRELHHVNVTSNSENTVLTYKTNMQYMLTVHPIMGEGYC